MNEIIIHILFWVSTTWLITSSFSISAQDIEIINGEESITIVRDNGLFYQLILCIIVSFIAFYINSWLIVKSNQSKKTKTWRIILTIAAAMIAVHFLTDYQFFTGTPPIPKQIAFGVIIFYIALSTAYGLIKRSIRDMVYLQQLVVDKKQAELNLLRNQLQPHFLFNALNNLLSMVNSSQNPKLVSSIDKLSGLLRFVIEENKADKISISKEIEFLKNYIDLQMLRFEAGEVNVQFRVLGAYNTQKVEPGLFIPFIENAFKYGAEPEISTNIEIDFDLSQSRLVVFKIKNPVLLNSINGVGTGIDTTRKRLDLIYPGNHELKISNANDFIVQLTINTK